MLHLHHHLHQCLKFLKNFSTDSLPDATQTDCSKCSEKQKIGSEKVTHYLIDNKPELWERLAKIYDKEGVFKAKYLAEKEKLYAENSENAEK